MIDYQRIIKDCFWDYYVVPQDIINIIESNDKRELQKLFSKIIYNSKDKLKALKLFNPAQIKELFDNFKPTYNERYINRHILVLRSLLLGEKHYIKGLEWKNQ